MPLEEGGGVAARGAASVSSAVEGKKKEQRSLTGKQVVHNNGKGKAFSSITIEKRKRKKKKQAKHTFLPSIARASRQPFSLTSLNILLGEWVLAAFSKLVVHV